MTRREVLNSILAAIQKIQELSGDNEEIQRRTPIDDELASVDGTLWDIVERLEEEDV